MSRVSIVGYATIMDPENARKLGLGSNPDIVWIHRYQRFFGLLDIVGKRLEDLFDRDKNLLVRDIGATTVEASRSHKYNAVIYNDVPEGVVEELDRIEDASHLVRASLDEWHIINFRYGSSWTNGGKPIFVYVAQPYIEIPRIGILNLVRVDVLPNLNYLRRCREAASVQGDDFRSAYEDTTFLADRKTSLRASGI